MSGVQYSAELLAKAEQLVTYPDTLTDIEGTTWPVIRCGLCHNAIVHMPETAGGKAFHLLTHHGYRMDGRQEGHQQEEAERAAERGEMNAYHRP